MLEHFLLFFNAVLSERIGYVVATKIENGLKLPKILEMDQRLTKMNISMKVLNQ